MIISNYHSHFKLDDGSGELKDYAEYALTNKMDIIGTSPHAPLPYKNDWALTEDGLEQYLTESKKLKELYKDKIEIYTGLEIDYINKNNGPKSERWNNIGLDYKIGSVHSITDTTTGLELTIDGPTEDIYTLLKNRFAGNIKLLVKEYFRLQQEMVTIGGFDILGHCDLLKKRNQNNRFFDQEEKWYKNTAQELLYLVADTGIVVEVNTGGISRGAIKEVYPSLWMLKKCKELNIPLTLSSDAHSYNHLDFYFTESIELLKKIGYKEIFYFSKGEWVSQPIVYISNSRQE